MDFLGNKNGMVAGQPQTNWAYPSDEEIAAVGQRQPYNKTITVKGRQITNPYYDEAAYWEHQKNISINQAAAKQGERNLATLMSQLRNMWGGM